MPEGAPSRLGIQCVHAIHAIARDVMYPSQLWRPWWRGPLCAGIPGLSESCLPHAEPSRPTTHCDGRPSGCAASRARRPLKKKKNLRTVLRVCGAILGLSQPARVAEQPGGQRVEIVVCRSSIVVSDLSLISKTHWLTILCRD